MRTKDILYPTDFSETASHAMEHVIEMANLYGVNVRVLHVTSDTVSAHYYGIAVSTPVALEQKLAAFVDSKMAQLTQNLRSRLNESINVSAVVRHGDVVDEILAESDDVGLVIIASHGDTGLKHFLRSQVAEAVVNRAKCPVLVVK